MNDVTPSQQPERGQSEQVPASPPRISRRAALRTWITGAAPLVLLAACTGPTAVLSGGTRAGIAASAGPGVQTSAAAAQVASAQGQAASSQRASGQAGPAQGGSVQQSLPACVITPQQTEGPYFVDERLNRSDIRSDPADGSVRDGTLLKLSLQVTQVAGNACSPLAGVYVDLWQCDALGIYSDVNDRSTGSTAGTSSFLRGYQVTDESGLVQFITIFPGWYRGRAVHIHFKVRTALDAQNAREMTSQLYFDDALLDQIHAQPPYAAKGPRDLRNNQDGIFRNGGSQLLVPVSQDAEGYTGTFNLGVQLT